jgi:hypothetical protein
VGTFNAPKVKAGGNAFNGTIRLGTVGGVKRPLGEEAEEGAAKKPKVQLKLGGGGGGLSVGESLKITPVEDDDDDVPLAALQDGSSKASSGGGKAKASGSKKKDGTRPKRERNRSKKAPPSLAESAAPSIDTTPSVSVDSTTAGGSWIQQQQPLISLAPPLPTGPPVAPLARTRPPLAQRFEHWESAAKTILEKIWKHVWVKPPKAIDPSRLPKGERDKPVPKTRYGFEEPVVVRWPNLEEHYLSIVAQPMDLTSVRSRLTQKSYATPDDFLTDVDRVFTNCLTYNASEEQLYIYNREVCEVARHLRLYLDALASEFIAPREGQAYEDRLFNRSVERHEALRKQREESLRQRMLHASDRSVTFNTIIGFVRFVRNDKDIKLYFFDPVGGSPEFLQSYRAKIKQPMCIKEVLEALESTSGPGIRVGDVIDMLQLIVNNAVSFNQAHAAAGDPVSKEVIKQAYRIQDLLEDRLQKALLEVWEYEQRLPVQARIDRYAKLQADGINSFADAGTEDIQPTVSFNAAGGGGAAFSAGNGQQAQPSQRSRAPTKQPAKHAERREASLKLRKERDESAEQEKAAKKQRDRRVKEEIMEEVWRHVHLHKHGVASLRGQAAEEEGEEKADGAPETAPPTTPEVKAEPPLAAEEGERERAATPTNLPDPDVPELPRPPPVQVVDLAPVMVGRGGGEEERRRKGRAVLEELLGGRGNVRRKEKVHARLDPDMAEELRKQLQSADATSSAQEEEEEEGEGMEVEEEAGEAGQTEQARGTQAKRRVHVLCHKVDPPRWAQGEWEGGLPSLAFPSSPLLHLTVLAAAPPGGGEEEEEEEENQECDVLLNGQPCEGGKGQGAQEGGEAGLKVDLGGVPVSLGFRQHAKAKAGRGESRSDDCTLGSLQVHTPIFINRTLRTRLLFEPC